MDAAQYKDYVLTLLFIKYVTDRFKGDPDAQIEIPEKGGSFDDLVGIIDQADFDDDSKLGSGKEKVSSTRLLRFLVF